MSHTTCSQPQGQHGKQVRAACQPPRLAKAVVAKATARLARRQRQVAAKEAREKKERIIADVWHEIQRKRDMAGTRPPNPVPVKPRTGHAVTVPPVEPSTRSEKKGEVRNGQGGPRKRKREANENGKNTAPPKQTGTDMQQHDSGCGTPASATDAGEFRYACPVCEGAVTSTVRTGRVASALRAILSQGRERRGQKVCLLLSLLWRQCGKYCADRASEPPRNMRQPILCPGRTCEHGDAAAPPQVSSVRYSSVVRAFVGTNSRNACDAVGETLLDDALAGRETSVACMTKKAMPAKQLPQHGKSQLQIHFGPGEAFGTGAGGHPSVLKPDKASQGASRSMAKASSKDILGLRKPLGWGPGAIRQF